MWFLFFYVSVKSNCVCKMPDVRKSSQITYRMMVYYLMKENLGKSTLLLFAYPGRIGNRHSSLPTNH